MTRVIDLQAMLADLELLVNTESPSLDAESKAAELRATVQAVFDEIGDQFRWSPHVELVARFSRI